MEAGLATWGDLVDFVPDVIEWLRSAWLRCPTIQSTDLEPAITKKLHRALILCAPSHLPLRVDAEVVLEDVENDLHLGTIDFRFTGQSSEHLAYLGFEAKTLNVLDSRGRNRSQAGKYVDDGLLRFISGKYPTLLGRAGMIGYVMNGDCDGAIKAVGRAMDKRARNIGSQQLPSLRFSSFAPMSLDLRESLHSLPKPTFVLDHLFLPYGQKTQSVG